MISQTAEYALRAVVRLAEGHPSPHTTAQIADATRTPAGYLAKVMQSLCRAGVVRSRRGQGGGFTLNIAPTALSVLKVINAVDPMQRITQCPLGSPRHSAGLCPLHRRLDEAMESVEKSFCKTTIDQLLPGAKREEAACRFPSEAGVNC